MKIFCWNINSLPPTVKNAVLRWGSYKGLFKEYESDVVCLQETKVRDDNLTKELCCVDGFQSFWAISRERKGYSGVATYASTSFAPLACEVDCLGTGDGDIDREGRVVLTDHGAFVLVNVYVPNAGERPARARLDFKLRFLRALKAKCDALAAQGREVVIAGDFNVAASPQDVHPTIRYDELYAPEERGAMLALLRDYADIWRRLHPDATDVYSVWDEYTNARAFNWGLRIDYFLCTPGLLGRVVSCEMLPTPPKWSDHAGMVLELRDIPPLPLHTPCPQWTKLLRRFHDTSQRSVAAMFGKKQKAAPCEGGGTPAAAPAQQPAQPQQEPQQEPQRQEQQQQRRQRQQKEGEGGTGPSGEAAPPASPAASPNRAAAHREQSGASPAAVERPGVASVGQQGRREAGQAGAGAGEGASAASGREAAPGEGAQAGQPDGQGQAGRPQQVSRRAAAGGSKGGSGTAAAAGGGSGSRKRKAGAPADKGGGKGGAGGGGQRSIASFFAPSSQD